MCRLVCAFVVHKLETQVFLRRGTYIIMDIHCFHISGQFSLILIHGIILSRTNLSIAQEVLQPPYVDHFFDIFWMASFSVLVVSDSDTRWIDFYKNSQ